VDIKSEKLNLIEWLAGVNDNRIIRQSKTFQKSSQQEELSSLSKEEKIAVDKGLDSIANGRTHSNESVLKSTKEKYPRLFK
jgi:hypothetical protein